MTRMGGVSDDNIANQICNGPGFESPIEGLLGKIMLQVMIKIRFKIRRWRLGKRRGYFLVKVKRM